MKKTFTETITLEDYNRNPYEEEREYTVEPCTALGDPYNHPDARVEALFVRLRTDYGEEKQEWVVFNQAMPEDDDDFYMMMNYAGDYDWENDYRVIESVELVEE
jgi:hypothetical protein